MLKEAVIHLVLGLLLVGSLIWLTGCDESTTNNISMTGVQSPITTTTIYNSCDAHDNGECRK